MDKKERPVRNRPIKEPLWLINHSLRMKKKSDSSILGNNNNNNNNNSNLQDKEGEKNVDNNDKNDNTVDISHIRRRESDMDSQKQEVVVLAWLHSVFATNNKPEEEAKLPRLDGPTSNSFCDALSDGILLCELLNTLYPKTVNITPHKKTKGFPFRKMENIHKFTQHLSRILKDSSHSQEQREDIFEPLDLSENRNFAKVITTLNILKRAYEAQFSRSKITNMVSNKARNFKLSDFREPQQPTPVRPSNATKPLAVDKPKAPEPNTQLTKEAPSSTTNTPTTTVNTTPQPSQQTAPASKTIKPSGALEGAFRGTADKILHHSGQHKNSLVKYNLKWGAIPSTLSSAPGSPPPLLRRNPSLSKITRPLSVNKKNDDDDDWDTDPDHQTDVPLATPIKLVRVDDEGSNPPSLNSSESATGSVSAPSLSNTERQKESINTATTPKSVSFLADKPQQSAPTSVKSEAKLETITVSDGKGQVTLGVRRGKCEASGCACDGYYKVVLSTKIPDEAGGPCLSCGHYPTNHTEVKGKEASSTNPPLNLSSSNKSGGDETRYGNSYKNWLIKWKDVERKFKIGDGAFSTVWRAKLWGKVVALKELKLEAGDEWTMNEFKSEVEIMCGLRHPQILLFMGAVLEQIDGESKLCLITELMERGSLDQVIRALHASTSEPILYWSRCISMAVDGCNGMNYLHQMGIVHRDLKSANLLVDKNFTVKVADFGLSKVKADTSSDNDLGGAFTIGTPGYIAPELINRQPYTAQTDVYAMGVILWELLSMEYPFVTEYGYDDLAIAAAVLREERPKIPGYCPANYRDLIEKCWAQEPDQRPSFEDVAFELRQIVGSKDFFGGSVEVKEQKEDEKEQSTSPKKKKGKRRIKSARF